MSSVYPPSEDSFLLADTVTGCSFRLLLDVGTGSGLVCLEVSRAGRRAICTDILFQAAKETRRNALNCGLYSFVDVVVGDLTKHIRLERVDLIAFNPPYLQPDQYSTPLDIATVRFQNGDIIKRFIELMTKAPKSVKILLVASSLTPLEDVLKIAKDAGFSVKIVKRRALFYERLYVVELSH